jgi:hypothetical protein
MTGILKKISPTALFLIVVMIVMAVFFVTSIGYKEPKVALMPSLMSGASILLALIALYNDFKSGPKGSAPTDEEGDVIEEEERKGTPLSDYFLAFLWFAALIVLTYFLGFIVSIPVWMFIYLTKMGITWWKSLATGVGLIVILYVVFTTVLQIVLYRGLLGDMLFTALGM